MTSDADEIERLRRENAALNEQVKLLVKTEQRLYRSQNVRELQLDRIRALADLALAYSDAGESKPAILARALRLLEDSFQVEGVRAFLKTSQGYSEVGTEGSSTPLVDQSVHGDIEQCIAATPSACVELGAVPETLRSAFALPELGASALIPLTDVKGQPLGLILAWREAAVAPSYHRIEMGPRHLPYVQLLRQHVESALRSALLTAELRENSTRLATSNERLSSSLERLERTQQELLQARKMEAVGRLAGGIAHDFNNLLTVILNHARRLEEASPPRSEEREAAARILEAGRSAADITRQLLAFGRKEARRPAPIDLNAVTADMARMLGRLLGERVRLQLELGPAPSIVRADPTQVEQALLNLVVNARDAMPEGGTLRIRTQPGESVPTTHETPERPEEYLALSVSDTGQGIDNETLSHIFEPFFTTKQLGQGTGLGLAMVYGAVRQNGGVISVVSTPHVGTTFTIFLPRVTGPLPATANAGSSTPAASGLTALVVEDEVHVREVTALILERHGYEVVEAGDAEEAFARISQVPSVDIVVTDVVLPGATGVQLVERLRQERPGLPALYLSGYSFDKLDTAKLTPFDEFLQKPFTPEALCARAAQVVAASQQQPASPPRP